VKKLCLLVALVGIGSVVFSQSSQPRLVSGWERITIENVASFDIPPTMELQNDPYKIIKQDKLVENILKIQQQTFQVIVQQKGLNENTEEGFSRYARVMFKTEPGSGDPDLNLNFDIGEFGPSDIAGLNEIYKGATIISFGNTGLKLLEWYPLKVEKINGMSCLHISYKRQLLNNEPVIVHVYNFFNVDYEHSLTLSYRLNEKDYWEKDFSLIVRSLRIIKKR